MLKFVFEKIRDLLANQPIIRTLLIVLSVFYVIKSQFLYDQSTKDGIHKSEAQATEAQLSYQTQQRNQAVGLSLVLFIIFLGLRWFNVRAERREIQRRKDEGEVDGDDEEKSISWHGSEDDEKSGEEGGLLGGKGDEVSPRNRQKEGREGGELVEGESEG